VQAFFCLRAPWRALALTASLVAAVANGVTPMLSGETLFVPRAVNGACAALMLWQALQIAAVAWRASLADRRS
jgi:hypothetical protein